MRKWMLPLFPLIVFLLLALLFWKGLSLNPRELPSVRTGQSLPEFYLSALSGERLLTKKDLPRKWFILNVWASWCQACVEEQTFLLKLQREGVSLIGLNYKDDNTDALRWLEQWGNPFELVLQDVEGKTAIDLGVYGAPENFLVNKNGIIVYRHVGVLNDTIWNSEFIPRIKHDAS